MNVRNFKHMILRKFRVDLCACRALFRSKNDENRATKKVFPYKYKFQILKLFLCYLLRKVDLFFIYKNFIFRKKLLF